MLLRRITDFILQSRLHAMGTAFVCAFLPLISTVSAIIAGLVTLRKGVQEGALVLVAATLPVLLSYIAFPNSMTNYAIGPTDMVLMIVAINVLTWLFAVALRWTASWSLMLQFAALVSIIAIIGVHIAYPDVQAWWKEWLTQYFNNIEQAVGQTDPQSAKARHDVVTNTITTLSPYATGIVAVVLSFYALLQLLLARWWQATIYNPGGLSKELLQIRLSYVAGLAFVVGAVLSYWGSPLVIDVMPTMCLVFSLAGLSLLHYIVKAKNAGWLWLAIVYIGIMIAPVTVLLVSVIGLLDTSFDVRKRIQNKV